MEELTAIRTTSVATARANYLRLDGSVAAQF